MKATTAGWISLGAAAVALYLSVFAPGESRVRATLAHARDLYDLARQNDRFRERAAGFAAARDRVRDELGLLSSTGDPSHATLAAIALLKRVGERRHVSLTAFTPSGLTETRKGASDLTITIDGRYGDLVSAVADLSRGDVLLQLSGVRIAATTLQGGVDATIQATMYDPSTLDDSEVRRLATADHE